jgi:LPS sulfotransferase NodH
MRGHLLALKNRLTTFLFRHGSRLVDMEWYREKNTLGSLGRRLPVLHYWLLGSKATTHCHPLFHNAYFLQQCQKVGLTPPQKPLKTYLTDKTYWNIDPHPLFDSRFYTQQLNDTLQISPLMHYIQGGHRQYDPHPLFQQKWYFNSFPNLEKLTHHCPLVHYIKTGYLSTVSTHPLFHADYYKKQINKNLSQESSNIDLLSHFVGSDHQFISCHPLFSIPLFIEQITSSEKIFVHNTSAADIIINEYLLNKARWKYNTHLLFDTEYYLAQKSGGRTDRSPLEEYIACHFGKRNPHPLFHTQWYQGRKKNILAFTGQSRVPLVHFVMNGQYMGESPHPLFALQWYRHTYMQGELSDTNPLIEFICHGESQGNRPNPLYPQNWQEILYTQYRCTTLSEFSKKYPVTLPTVRNRMTDAFSIDYLTPNEGTPAKCYLILFTPRSGSSWLTDLLSQNNILGRPTEWFNPDLIQSAMNGLTNKCHNINEYCKELQNTHQSPQGYFGAELTATHLSLLSELVDINHIFNNPKYIVLLRKNIVAQGVSLFLATETGYFHSTNTINQKNNVEYSEHKIRKWIDEILKDEKFIFCHLDKGNINFKLSWYEELQSNTALFIDNMIEHITEGSLSKRDKAVASKYTSIKADKNSEFERKFREGNAEYVQCIENERPFPCAAISLPN